MLTATATTNRVGRKHKLGRLKARFLWLQKVFSGFLNTRFHVPFPVCRAKRKGGGGGGGGGGVVEVVVEEVLVHLCPPRSRI